MKYFILFAAFLAAASAVTYEDVVVQEYNLYKAQFGKSYETPLENSRRMQIFLENKYEVAQHNLKYKNGEVTYDMEINEFSDWLPEEIEKLISYKGDPRETLPSRKLEEEIHEASNATAPDSINWVEKGAVSPVKNQGKCGSCYAFSALGALESQHYLKTKKMVRLSEQQIVDCSGKYGNEGCNGGYISETFKYVKENGGVNTEASYPYEAKEGQCRYKKENNGATCAGFEHVGSTETALKEAVYKIGPISTSIHVMNTFIKYKSGVYYDEYCYGIDLVSNHAVLVVGYGSESGKDYWLVKNSWGDKWGDKGYIKMARNKNNMCNIAVFPMYPKV